MKDYLLHMLSPGAFEELVVRICHELLGFGTISFSSGRDGGRDAFFEGTAQRFPSEADPWAGGFVIQAKHTEKADASCSDSDFGRVLKKEAPKVAALRQADRCDNYLLFTNRKLGALKEDELVGNLREKTGVANVAILGKETITSYLDGAPEIAEAAGLQLSPFVAGQPTIPPPTRDFAGRTDELEELRRMVDEHGGALIYGVRGLGGIGKTELGLRLVEMVGADYPDGHILVELGGASDHPLTSADAMASVIRAYEPQLRLPEAEADLRRMYHRLLKDRRAIVLLDDAAGAEQVKPLLPHTGCLTLVTSRQRFALPKLHRLDLDALTPEAAQELLLSLAPRLGADVERIAGLLGRLPLALRLAGSAFAERPDLEPDEYIRRLGDRDERVGLVEAAIGFNYEALEPEVQQLWRSLAVFPGDFDVAGAAAVWAIEADAAKGILGGSLYPVSLVEWRGERCRLHDLARDFAATRVENRERYTAALRHAGHYIEVLRETTRLYREGGGSVLHGLKLFDTEWSNIRVGQAWAAAHAGDTRDAAEHCIAYSGAGFVLNLRLHPSEWIRWLEVARSTAVSLGDRRGEGFALGNLGLAFSDLGEPEKAIGYYEQTLEVSREIGDQWAEGAALGNLGVAYSALGEFEKAIDIHEQALVVAREIGDRHMEASALTGLGLTYADLGKVESAIGQYEQAHMIASEIGDLRGAATALGNLGVAHKNLGELEQAINCYEQTLVITRAIGDRRSVGSTLTGLGQAFAQLGDWEKAINLHEQALMVHREVGDRRGEATDLGNLGAIFANLGKVDKAATLLEQTIEIGQAIKDPRIVRNASGQLEQLSSCSRPESRSRSRLNLWRWLRNALSSDY